MDPSAKEPITENILRRSAYQGSHFEIGYRMGPQLATVKIPPFNGRVAEFAARCEALVGEVYPPLLEKVEGMVEGSGLDPQGFKTYYYGRGGPAEIGCTNFAVLPKATANGQILVGSNYDWFFEARKWREVRLFRPDGVYGHAEVTHHWAGSPDVINDQGLVVLLAALPGIEPRGGAGVQWHMIIEILMETCKDTEEARKLITDLPHLRAFNYLVADTQGRAFVAEATPQRVNIREAESGILVATNHLPGREFPEDGRDERQILIQRMSITRFQRAQKLLSLRRGKIDREYAQEVLRDHEGFICRGEHPGFPHRGGFHEFFGTIWSLVSLPVEKGFHLAAGHPCLSEYQWFGFEDGQGTGGN